MYLSIYKEFLRNFMQKKNTNVHNCIFSLSGVVTNKAFVVSHHGSFFCDVPQVEELNSQKKSLDSIFQLVILCCLLLKA